MTIEINTNILWVLAYGLGLYLIMFLSYLSAIYFSKWRDRIKRQEMIEDFLDHMADKMKTEEDFNEIVRRMRRDFGDGAGV
jgi:hypothetical protein